MNLVPGEQLVNLLVLNNADRHEIKKRRAICEYMAWLRAEHKVQVIFHPPRLAGTNVLDLRLWGTV
jgi:hypothetical protein